MCVVGAPHCTMCHSGKRFWSLLVLATVAAIALAADPQRVGTFPSLPVKSLKSQLSSKPAFWEGLLKQGPDVSQTNAALDEITAFRRKAVRNEAKRWPNAIVPYVIAPSIGRLSSSALSMIKEAIRRWETETCIRFVPANVTKDKDVVVIQEGFWCSSYVGRIGGRQEVNLAPGCLRVGTIIHELGHAIGWKHEHTRPDRDKYIEIMSKKINDPNYKKYDHDRVNTFDVPYDYSSIMHYPGSNTLRAIDPTMQRTMGQRLQLSFYDVKLANLMYKCAERNRCNLRHTKCNGEGYVGPKCTCVCRDGSRRCAANGVTTTRNTRPSLRTSKVKPV